jgi:tetratricopeptide (TPR) repeat protein
LVLSKILSTLFIWLILFANLTAQNYPDKKVDSLLKSGIRYIVNQNYTEAEITFKNLDREFPELPFGKIYLAANKIAEAFDYAEPFDENYISHNLESAGEQSEKLLEKDENDVWKNYFVALVEGYTAYFDALSDGWLTAFSDGFNSVSSFEKCLELNNKFYEAHIAIGTFAYWKSRKTEFLNWMPFVSDDREFAIKQLETAIDSASYNTHLARHSLIWIYLDKKDFTSAIKLAEKALEEFPASRLFKFGLARAVEDVDRERAINIYSEILNSYPQRKNNSRVNEIILKHKIAQQYSKSGKNQEALKLCDEILAIDNLSEYAKDRLSRRLERVKNLKQELTTGN